MTSTTDSAYGRQSTAPATRSARWRTPVPPTAVSLTSYQAKTTYTSSVRELDQGRSHDRHDARLSKACGPRRRGSSSSRSRPGSGSGSTSRRVMTGPTRAETSPCQFWTEPPAVRCRWARLRTRRDARRWSPPSLLWAVELPRESAQKPSGVPARERDRRSNERTQAVRRHAGFRALPEPLTPSSYRRSGRRTP